jgi:cation diffusion facilitator CzcD-associated flavoprotein CzcO
MDRMDAEAIVIGGGLAGLSCALELRDRGVRGCVVLEANTRVGLVAALCPLVATCVLCFPDHDVTLTSLQRPHMQVSPSCHRVVLHGASGCQR